MKPIERLHLTCLFSEDVRPEASGQTTMVGWFTGGAVQMNTSGPMMFHKFCATGLLEVPLGHKIAKLKLELRLGEKSLHSIELPPGAFADLGKEAGASEQRFGIQVSMGMQLGNFAVPDEGTIRMCAVVDGEEIMSNGLRFVRPNKTVSPPTQA